MRVFRVVLVCVSCDRVVGFVSVTHEARHVMRRLSVCASSSRVAHRRSCRAVRAAVCRWARGHMVCEVCADGRRCARRCDIVSRCARCAQLGVREIHDHTVCAVCEGGRAVVTPSHVAHDVAACVDGTHLCAHGQTRLGPHVFDAFRGCRTGDWLGQWLTACFQCAFGTRKHDVSSTLGDRGGVRFFVTRCVA